MNDLASIRDEVLRTARVEEYLMSCGAQRGRGGRWHSPFREDRNPSITVKGNRATDWGTGERFTVVDLVMRRDGCDYVKALRTIAAENAITWPDLSPKERQELREKGKVAQRIAADAADWVHGLRIVCDQRKARLMALAEAAWSEGSDALGDKLAGIVERIPRWALSPESADPVLIVKAYRESAIGSPAVTRRMLAYGRSNRENAEAVGTAIVALVEAVELGAK